MFNQSTNNSFVIKLFQSSIHLVFFYIFLSLPIPCSSADSWLSPQDIREANQRMNEKDIQGKKTDEALKRKLEADRIWWEEDAPRREARKKELAEQKRAEVQARDTANNERSSVTTKNRSSDYGAPIDCDAVAAVAYANRSQMPPGMTVNETVQMARSQGKCI